MPAKRKAASSAPSSATIGFEAKLWLTADKLRNNMDAADWSGATPIPHALADCPYGAQARSCQRHIP